MPYLTDGPEMEQYILEHFDEAMEKGYLKVYCQPVIRISTRRICGMEALSRWEDPDRGVLMPDHFIGVLEAHRRIHELDAFVIREVCGGYRAAMRGDAFVPISINLSRLDYELCDIFEVVESAVRANKLPRSNLCIEITESLLNDNETLMRRYIERFRSAGYPVWMDDFGSGYSSLNVLKDYQFDELKIDMKFLSDFSPRSKTILSSIIHMAKQIGIQTLTEGVETEEQLAFLRNIGCEKAQGYLFSQPIPFRTCLRRAEELGLRWEKPVLRAYYDELGQLDVLSATPFRPPEERQDPGMGRALNSIPLAVLELRENRLHFLFTNSAFDMTVQNVDPRISYVCGPRPDGRSEALKLEETATAFRKLLEETRAVGKGRMHFVHAGEYYEAQARRLSMHHDRCAILLRMENLSEDTELDRKLALDDGLRQIYAVYDRVTMLDLNAGTVTGLYLDSREEDLIRDGSLDRFMRVYAQERIFPADRDRYREFVDPDTIAARIGKAGKGYVSVNLRTLNYRGGYIWKTYALVHLRDAIFYLLVRDMDADLREMRDMLVSIAETTSQPDLVTPSMLWESLMRNAPLKLFWKDRDRRFLGASQSFLDFYGFNSLSEIIGKNDEEMGWHLHPDNYRDHELDVIREGHISRNQPGTCIIRGESQNIVASKLPIYDDNGGIRGLLGYFYKASGDETGVAEPREQTRQDVLTGLLNTRALDEDKYAYQDEYALRGTDFVRIDVAIEDLPEINQHYGFDFGDSVIRAVGQALLQVCGTTATVGRLSGSQFTVFRQIERPDAVEQILGRIRSISSDFRTVDGVPFTPYLSVGAALYSETESVDEQAFQASLRRMTDDLENVTHSQLRENMSRLFYMYEDLPLAYAVYKVVGEAERPDAILIYSNRMLSQLLGIEQESMIGRRVSRLFPHTPPIWYASAWSAAFENEPSVGESFVDPFRGRMRMTTNRVIGPGYCAFTYQKEDT